MGLGGLRPTCDRISRVLALSATVLLSSAVARAESPAESAAAPEAQQEEARRLYDEGARASKAGQLEQARDYYTRALGLHAHWQIAASLGRVESQMGNYRGAAEHLDFALREAPADKRPALREQAQGMLNEARAKVGALRIAVSVPGAEVLVGGKVIGKAPLRSAVFVEPGPVVVEARLDGYAGAREARTAGAGVEEHIDLVLGKESLAPVAKPQPVDMSVREGPNKGVLIGGTALGAAFAMAGVGLLVASNNKGSSSHQLESPNDYCKTKDACQPAFEGLQRDKVTLGNLSIAGFIAGGAMLVGTWTYGGVALATKPRSEARIRADVAVSSERAVGTLTIRW